MGSDLARLLDPNSPPLYRSHRPSLPSLPSLASPASPASPASLASLASLPSQTAVLHSPPISSSSSFSPPASGTASASHPLLVHDPAAPITLARGHPTPPPTSRRQTSPVTAHSPPAASWTAVNHPPRNPSVTAQQLDGNTSRGPASSLPQLHPHTPPQTAAIPTSFASSAPGPSLSPLLPDASPQASPWHPGPLSPQHQSGVPQHFLQPTTPPSPAPSPVSVFEAAIPPVPPSSSRTKRKASDSPPSDLTQPGGLIKFNPTVWSSPPNSSQLVQSSQSTSHVDSSAHSRRRARSVRFAEQSFKSTMMAPPEPASRAVSGVPQGVAPPAPGEATVTTTTVEGRPEDVHSVSNGTHRHGGAPGCNDCYAKIREELNTLMGELYQGSWSIQNRSLSEYHALMDRHRALFPPLREKASLVTGQCSQCSTLSQEDQTSITIAFLREPNRPLYESGKRKTVSEGSPTDSEESTKARKLTPECTPHSPSPTLCQTTPPPEAGDTSKQTISLQQAGVLMAPFFERQPEIRHMTVDPSIQRVAESLLLSGEPRKIALQDQPAIDYSMYGSSDTGHKKSGKSKVRSDTPHGPEIAQEPSRNDP